MIFVSVYFSNAQQDSLPNNEYITTFLDKISTRISLVNTSNSFYLNNKSEGIKYKLIPHKTDYLNFSTLFRSLELDFGFAPNFIGQNKDNKNSKLFTLNFRMFYNQWMQTIDLYDQKGFYLEVENQKEDISGMKTFKIGGSTSYIFNKDYSFRAIGFQNEWQTKSAGSFIPRFFFYYTKYSLKNEGYNNTAHSYDFAIAPSYFYSLVLGKNFLLSLGGSLGMGVNYNKSLGEEDLVSALFEYSGRAVFSYNSKTLFGGINSSLLIFDHNVDRFTRQNDDITYLEFYIGYRFKAPKKLMKLADDVNEKIKI